MNDSILINNERLLKRLIELGNTGRDNNGVLTRLTLSESDKKGRDLVVSWMKQAKLDVKVDKIGNIFGVWETQENKENNPVMIGSHIDSVINAGIYDGCYGVISGLEVIRTLQESGFKPNRPIVVGAFTNEEGVRYQPDMMGSLVYVGGLDVDKALDTIGIDGTRLGDELEKIGYAGDYDPGFIKPYAYIELHVEQGPILDSENITVGAVENLQGISWQKVIIKGEANHAGTTPTRMRVDAGLAAAKVITFLRDRADMSNDTTVSTVGSMEFEPNLINVIPSKVTFTVDLRNPNDEKLKEEEKALDHYLRKLEVTDKVNISTKRLVRFEPVIFDENIVKLVENAARNQGLKCRRMTSGAGHDAQMMARICPTAMIFAPSIKGISHNPEEFTKDEDLEAGANILLDVTQHISN
ncbi:MAG: Zn-dependent hydrolase [Tissierellaceae bacterium]|nr:Zn-dependent hydrolase [Tissierellaceae bacterium]